MLQRDYLYKLCYILTIAWYVAINVMILFLKFKTFIMMGTCQKNTKASLKGSNQLNQGKLSIKIKIITDYNPLNKIIHSVLTDINMWVNKWKVR